MTPIISSMRMQLTILLRSPARLSQLLTLPLFTIALVSIMRHANRADLVPYAIIGSSIMAVWSMAINVSGDIVESERQNATLEPIIASPSGLAPVVFGRTLQVTLVSLVSVLESVAVAWLVFGVTIHVRHIFILCATLVCSGFAMAGTATALAGAFVLARSARTFQNSLTYPLYLLGGAVVPTTFLPGWLQPLTRLVFLSWTSGLLRDAVKARQVTNVGWRLAAVSGLGLVAYIVGVWILALILRRVRSTGSLAYA